MTDDARFEDAGEGALNLGAFDAEDLKVISALVQDAVFPASEMAWTPRSRRFALLLNRFRWEDRRGVEGARPPERVQSVLSVSGVLGVASQGVQRGDPDLVLSLLSVEFLPGEAPGGAVDLILAGDGAIRLKVEALDVSLRDVTRPYLAPSRKVPGHDA